MNYQKIYDNICKRGQERVLSKEIYAERHHIIPKCMGGSNDKSNLTILTAREHFICHWLLSEIYPTNSGLAYTFLLFNNPKKGSKRYISNSKIYAYAKLRMSESLKGSKKPERSAEHKEKLRIAQTGKKYSDESRKKMSESHKGQPGPGKGKHRSEETCKKISEKNKGRQSSQKDRVLSVEQRLKMSLAFTGIPKGPMSKSHKKNLSNANKGRIFSEEHRRKLSESHKGKILSEETKRKISEKFKGKNHPMFGKFHSEETKQKMREAKKKYA